MVKTLRSAGANLQEKEVISAGLHSYYDDYLAETKRLLANNDGRGFYEHLKCTVGLEVSKASSEHFIRVEGDKLLRDNERMRERWAGFYYK